MPLMNSTAPVIHGRKSGAVTNGLPSEMRDAILAVVPSLRAFAITLAHDVDRADDLVQDTIVKAWANWASLSRGQA